MAANNGSSRLDPEISVAEDAMLNAIAEILKNDVLSAVATVMREERDKLKQFVHEQVGKMSPAVPPIQVNIDLAPLTSALEHIGVQLDAAIDRLAKAAAATPVPVVHVDAPVVNLPGPVVNVEAPVVNVEAPMVTVEAPKRAKRRLNFTYDDDGNIASVGEE